VLPHPARPASGYRRNGAHWYNRAGRIGITEQGRRVIPKGDAITLALWCPAPGQREYSCTGLGRCSEICLTIYNALKYLSPSSPGATDP